MGLYSTVMGLAAGLVLLVVVQRSVLFTGAGVASLFLQQGRLAWALPAGAVLGIFGVALISSLMGALRPALWAGRIDPAEALRTE